jgi:hypothetical protein
MKKINGLSLSLSLSFILLTVFCMPTTHVWAIPSYHLALEHQTTRPREYNPYAYQCLQKIRSELKVKKELEASQILMGAMCAKWCDKFSESLKYFLMADKQGSLTQGDLLSLADVAMYAGDYELAHEKFTQAKNEGAIFSNHEKISFLWSLYKLNKKNDPPYSEFLSSIQGMSEDEKASLSKKDLKKLHQLPKEVLATQDSKINGETHSSEEKEKSEKPQDLFTQLENDFLQEKFEKVKNVIHENWKNKTCDDASFYWAFEIDYAENKVSENTLTALKDFLNCPLNGNKKLKEKNVLWEQSLSRYLKYLIQKKEYEKLKFIVDSFLERKLPADQLLFLTFSMEDLSKHLDQIKMNHMALQYRQVIKNVFDQSVQDCFQHQKVKNCHLLQFHPELKIFLGDLIFSEIEKSYGDLQSIKLEFPEKNFRRSYQEIRNHLLKMENDEKLLNQLGLFQLKSNLKMKIYEKYSFLANYFLNQEYPAGANFSFDYFKFQMKQLSDSLKTKAKSLNVNLQRESEGDDFVEYPYSHLHFSKGKNRL